MKIAVPRERRAHERRVAASPETAAKFIDLGFEMVVESGAGAGARFADGDFAGAGASVGRDLAATLSGADIVLHVQPPLIDDEGDIDEVALMDEGAVLVGMLAATESPARIAAYNRRRVTALALELMPRLSRAQSMDGLSSQSNLMGYRAVVDAAYEFARAFPMMMTSAGTVAPARVVVLGAGVAGLQAIATARRLGAVVSAFDVRPAAKEEVESLGGRFIEVEDREGTVDRDAVYATEMGEDYQRRQRAALQGALADADIAICSALIPGRRAPLLVTKEMVETMQPGSIIVDLAAASGGNCELSREGETVDSNGVTIVAHHNVPSRVAVDSSRLYARNLFNFVSTFVDRESGTLAIDWNDELVQGTLLTRDGETVHELLRQNGG
ncbi:MAG: Re/Si-specific NAD(P)(+) transhydrogenase subunit alpha [Alphaproteobacteria bacterium]|nr:Re/Si-specific NAD(P)(+) transhydrogenase subunit alpha [Alphaproteobacteria bacterium]